MNLLKPSEVAALLSVQLCTLEAWRHRKTGPALPYLKIGHSVRYRRSDVEKVIAAGLREAPTDAAR